MEDNIELQELRDKIDEIQSDLEKSEMCLPFMLGTMLCCILPEVSVSSEEIPEEIFDHMKVKEERNRFWQSIE